jgi:hypothetical protein
MDGVPVSAITFAKEAPSFLEINPSSFTVQKKLQLGPVFSVLAPDLSGNSVRSPARAFLCASPWI